jgi:formate hydrogenlyase subunit 5
LSAVDAALLQLRRLEDRLRFTSSFLDRLEEVGVVTSEAARDLDLLGPVGRASGLSNDLRRVSPYAGYREFAFEAACEKEGDGYARLRVLFFEAQQSGRLIRQAMEVLPPGGVCAEAKPTIPGPAIGWAEAPLGATVHWLRLDEDGRIDRYRILSPSFRNWLGFHVAVENFAFQDFPIILATFGLSATECDR